MLGKADPQRGDARRTLKAEVLTNLEHGLVLDDRWSDGKSLDDVVEHLAGLGGTEDEAVFAAAMLAARMAVGGGIIDTRGELQERDEGALLVTKGASLNAIMGALWADHHEDGLVGLGLNGDDLAAILASVDGRPKSFGAFLAVWTMLARQHDARPASAPAWPTQGPARPCA